MHDKKEHKMHRYFKMLIVVICLTLMFSAMFAQSKSTSKKPGAKNPAPAVQVPVIPRENILAEFKDGLITKQNLQDKIAKLPPQNQKRFKTIEGQIEMLDIMVVEEVFFLKARDMNLLTDPVVKEKIEAAKKHVLVQEYYKRNVNNKVSLTEADKQAYYNENSKEFFVQPYISILYIQPADEAAAKKALAELKKGVAFETVSNNYSINTYAKSVNGKIKNIRGNGYLPGIGNDAELDEIIMNAPLDTVNFMGPFQTSSGWSIIRIAERVEGRQRPYLECEAEVDQRLRPKKEAEMLEQLVSRQKLVYKVEIDTTTLGMMNLREPAQNAELLDRVVVTSSDVSLNMTAGQLQEKFLKLSPQEQMIYVTSGGAIKLLEQELSRSLMYLDALRDKSYDEYLENHEDYVQSKRYYVLQEAYKRLVLDQVNVTPEAKRDFYNARLQEYTTPSARKVTAVWVKDDKTAAKARKEMIKAVKKNNEKAIAKVLDKYNLKPQQANLDNNYQNGIVTSVGADQKLSDVIWNTPVGTVSPVTRTVRNDIVFFHVVEERPPFTKSYTEVEPRITNQLRQELATARMEEVKDQLFTEYNLKKYPEKLEIKLSADELFEMADNSARQRKFRDATVYYDQIIRFYPNGTDDYKASFMKAFLVAEEMGNKDMGLELFRDFLKKYPAGELNESAQYMIDELEGKNPEFEDIEPEE
jgi:peptidyl-prolyl cis-trans isomerase C